MGIDTVISTVTGASGLNLLHAAAQQGVRRFMPAEFEGKPASRPETEDMLDPAGSRKVIRQWCEYYQSQSRLEYTIVSCGVLYERFAPGGLVSQRLGTSTMPQGEGDFIVNLRTRMVNTSVFTVSGKDAMLCLSSAEDVARLLVRAVDLPRWPAELTIASQRLSVRFIIEKAQKLFGNSWR